MDIIKIGHKFQYTIPSFSVVKIELKHAGISVWDGSLRKVKNFDVFLRESPDNASKVPFSIDILESCDVDVSMYYNYTNIISAVALIRGLMSKKHGSPRLCLKSVLKNSTMLTRLSSVI